MTLQIIIAAVVLLLSSIVEASSQLGSESVASGNPGGPLVAQTHETSGNLRGARALAFVGSCGPDLNYPMLCDASEIYWEAFTCGPSFDNQANVQAVLRNPGENVVNLYLDGRRGLSNAWVQNSFDYDDGCFLGDSSTTSGTCVNDGPPPFEVTDTTVRLSFTTLAAFDVTAIFAGCLGTGRIYVDRWFSQAARAPPANPNPSGVETCATSLTAPTFFTDISSNTYISSTVPLCIDNLNPITFTTSPPTNPVTIAPGSFQS